jgi:hypothetical protein
MGSAEKRVLLLGGWSPGPLTYLKQVCGHNNIVCFEPSIATPPVGARCWVNPFLFLIISTVFIAYPYAVSYAMRTPGIVSVGISAAITYLTFLVLRNVLLPRFLRYSIGDCMRVARGVIEKEGIDCIIGFSWGGAIAWWMVAEGYWEGPTLMLAPTIEVMAYVGKEKFPMVNLSKNLAAKTVFFHCYDDPFCPKKQIERLRDTGAQMLEVDDNHIFLERASCTKIEAEMMSLLRA